jgi:hypothetical protein
VVGDFGQAHEALVGHAEPHIGDAGAGDVEGFEAQVGDDACRQGIESAGDDDATLGGHQFLEFLAEDMLKSLLRMRRRARGPSLPSESAHCGS